MNESDPRSDVHYLGTVFLSTSKNFSKVHSYFIETLQVNLFYSNYEWTKQCSDQNPNFSKLPLNIFLAHLFH